MHVKISNFKERYRFKVVIQQKYYLRLLNIISKEYVTQTHTHTHSHTHTHTYTHTHTHTHKPALDGILQRNSSEDKLL